MEFLLQGSLGRMAHLYFFYIIVIAMVQRRNVNDITSKFVYCEVADDIAPAVLPTIRQQILLCQLSTFTQRTLQSTLKKLIADTVNE